MLFKIFNYLQHLHEDESAIT